MKALLCTILLLDVCNAFVLGRHPPEAISRARRRSLSPAGAFQPPVHHQATRILPRPRQIITPTSPFPECSQRGLRMRVEGVTGEDDGAKEGDASDGERDPRIYSVRISRATGIDWGSDISFSWVYVRDLYPSGAAANCGQISVGDQLIAINDINLTGAPFDAAMDALIGAREPEVGFTFFRGSTDDLKQAVGAQDPPAEIMVTVKQKGKPEITLKAASGTNLRNLLTDNGINVYQSITRWTNCKGKQLCGTCIVEINKGLENCTVRSLDESSTLRDNPANYRLSCVTNMYDDVTVTVFPPVGAAQWTR